MLFYVMLCFKQKQLRQRMQQHVDTMLSQKRLSQDTIHSVQRKLTNLEQVLHFSVDSGMTSDFGPPAKTACEPVWQRVLQKALFFVILSGFNMYDFNVKGHLDPSALHCSSYATNV